MIHYMQRTREYYAALGYPSYSWTEHDNGPFVAPARRLATSRLALISTAAPVKPGVGDQGPGAAYNADAKFFDVYRAPIDPPPDLRISHIGYDRAHCRAEDSATWLPVTALRRAVAEDVVGQLANDLIGVPTNRSQRVTLTRDAPLVLAACLEQKVELALLVPT
jgi:hypothetical protein